LEALDRDGNTALHLAVSKRRLETARLLVAKKTGIEILSRMENATSLMLAVDNDDEKMTQVLLDYGARLETQDPFDYTALHRAAFRNALKAGETLIRNGADMAKPGNYGWTPLHCAVHRGHREFVQLLLEKGADISVRDKGWRTPRQLASSKEIYDLLSDHEACGQVNQTVEARNL